ARDGSDVAHVAAVRGDDERRVDLGREQSRRYQEVRPDDIGRPGGPHASAELEEAALAAGAAIEHGAVDLVAALLERALELRDEAAEVGIVGTGVHLRDEEDPHLS